MAKTLILDAGGVLISEPIPQLLKEVADRSGHDLQDLDRWYHQQLYPYLWSGKLGEKGFWGYLLGHAGIDPDQQDEIRALWLDWLQPLPAVEHLAGWAGQARLGILSNHLARWLHPVLVGSGIGQIIPEGETLISSQLGSCKPDPGIYQLAAQQWGKGENVLFVDDRPGNLEAAQQVCGWQTLLADADEEWTQAVDRWLKGQTI